MMSYTEISMVILEEAEKLKTLACRTVSHAEKVWQILAFKGHKLLKILRQFERVKASDRRNFAFHQSLALLWFKRGSETPILSSSHCNLQ